MNGSLFVKEIEPTSLKIKKDLSTLAKSLQTVTSKTIYVKSVRRLEELCGESKMKPFYVCEICTSSYQEDLRNNKDGHYVALSNEHPQPRKCKGTLQPAFLASDIEKLINGRIEQHKKNILESDQCIHMDYIQAEMLQCMALERLLSALEEVEK